VRFKFSQTYPNEIKTKSRQLFQTFSCNIVAFQLVVALNTFLERKLAVF